jgi:hypothetical protein
METFMSDIIQQALPGSTRDEQDKPWFFDVLPYRPQPYPDECLSGYLLRLAQANGFLNSWDMVKDAFPHFSQPSRMSILRWEYPVDDWGRLPQRTQLSRSALKGLTVLPWVVKFRPPPAVTLPRVSGPGRFLQGVVNPHLQVCSSCLQEQPYLRLMWRLEGVQVCVHHGCHLQAQCHDCGTPLTVLGPTHRHLHCAACGTDLRTLPVVAAPADILEAQLRQQAELQFLLDPEVTLIKDPTCDPCKAIGLKFRYLRLQAGRSVVAMARQLGTFGQSISRLELGQTWSSLPLYLAYLEELSWSWPDFAALQVPDEFVRGLKEPRFAHLRLCPTPECPNHHSPSGTSVNLARDLPELQRARFNCTACGRNFTRSYEGRLVTRSHRSRIPPGRSCPELKPAEEVTRLVEMGLQGLNNRQIAQPLGWDERTVPKYFQSLGMEEQVHEARARRQAQKQQERYAILCEHVEMILQSFLSQDEEFSVPNVSQALGFHSGFLRGYPDLRNYAQNVAQEHNVRVRQRRYEQASARIAQFIEDARQDNKAMTIGEVEKHAGLPEGGLVRTYPELYAMVRRTVQEHRAQMKAARTEERSARINEAAARLVAQGTRLTHKAILQEAGLHPGAARPDPTLLSLLRSWLGDFAARD